MAAVLRPAQRYCVRVHQTDLLLVSLVKSTPLQARIRSQTCSLLDVAANPFPSMAPMKTPRSLQGAEQEGGVAGPLPRYDSCPNCHQTCS